MCITTFNFTTIILYIVVYKVDYTNTEQQNNNEMDHYV